MGATQSIATGAIALGEVGEPELGKGRMGLQLLLAYLPSPSSPARLPAGVQAQVGVWRWQDTRSLVLGVVPRLPRREAGSPPCLGPRLNVWVGREGRGFGVWSPHFSAPGACGQGGPAETRSSLGRLRLAPGPPFCWLWDTTGQVEHAGGEGRLLCRSDLGLGGQALQGPDP